MNSTTKLTMLLFASALFMSCGEDEVASTCATTADCAAEELCHPYSKLCVGSCATSAAVCSGTSTPECKTTDGDPLENLCICDTNSCPTGETCSTSTGLCSGTGTGNMDEEEEEIPMGQTCTVGSLGAPCDADKLCVTETTCAAPCDDVADCVPTGKVCNEDIEATDFNSCADADDAAVCTFGCFDTCPARGSHTRDADGPIIYEVAILSSLGSTANCAAPSIVRQFRMNIFSSAGIPSTRVLTQVVRRLDGGNEANVFSDGDGMPSHPSVMSKGNNQYEATFTLCDTPSSMAIFAVFVRDSAMKDSNGVCFRPDTM